MSSIFTLRWVTWASGRRSWPQERLLLKALYLLWEKCCNYRLTTTQGDCCASCENIVSPNWRRLSPTPFPRQNPFLLWRRKKTARGISAFNFRWFQQPIRSCRIVLTVRVAAKILPQWAGSEHKLMRLWIRPNFSGSTLRENVWELIKLGLFSRYLVLK